MTKVKKRSVIAASLCGGVLLLGIALTPFVAVSASLREGGGCVAVVFDKGAVMEADRIVIREGETAVTITEPEAVREIAAAFVVANRTDLCGYHKDKWMEIYNGDTLVRHIHWNDHDELVEVYEADACHWIWPSYSKIGQVQLSDEMVAKLDEITSRVQG